MSMMRACRLECSRGRPSCLSISLHSANNVSGVLFQPPVTAAFTKGGVSGSQSTGAVLYKGDTRGFFRPLRVNACMARWILDSGVPLFEPSPSATGVSECFKRTRPFMTGCMAL